MPSVYDKGAQRAKLTTTESSNCNGKRHRLDDHFQHQWTLYNPHTRQELAVLRSYGTNARNTACLWVNSRAKQAGKSVYLSGSGQAGGYGYHRTSAAVAEAFESAGVKLKFSIRGVGDTAIEEAMQALARTLGYRKAVIVKAYA